MIDEVAAGGHGGFSNGKDAGFMELGAFWAALLRRWYLTLVGVAVAVGVTAIITINVGPTYKAEGTLVLFPPTTTLKAGSSLETQGNPYLMLGGLNQARDIVIRTMNSGSAMARFSTNHPLATYQASPDFTTSGPIILLDVESRTSDGAVAGLKTAMDTVPVTLESLQAGLGLPATAEISSKVLTTDIKPEVVHSGQIRTGILVGVAVLATMFFLLGLVDGLLEARRRRVRDTNGFGRRAGTRKHRQPSRSAGPPKPPRAAAVEKPDRATDEKFGSTVGK